MQKIKRWIDLWTFTGLKLNHLTKTWMRQKGAVQETHRMALVYWEKYVKPIGGPLADYSRPSIMDMLLFVLPQALKWQRIKKTYKKYREALDKIHEGYPDWWEEEDVEV